MRTKAVTARGQRQSPRRRATAAKPAEPRLRADGAPRAIMVLGMHRSGTSALTRVFGLLGADLPKNLMPADASNPTGHWESNDLYVIHDRLLASAGSSWHDWRAFNPDWFASPAARPFADEILAVLRKDFAGSRLFAIKDPRICRFWPLWRDVLAEFGAKPVIVMPVRNPLEVAASLKQRDGFIPAKSHLLWLRHVLDAEHATRGLPRAVTLYQSWLEDWQQAIATMTPQLRLSWPRRGAMVDLEIEQFLSAEFKHHDVTPERLAGKAEAGGLGERSLCGADAYGGASGRSRRTWRSSTAFAPRSTRRRQRSASRWR